MQADSVKEPQQPQSAPARERQPVKAPGPFTLITGASEGIGLSFAREYARRGRPLVLVALPEKRLEKVSARIQEEFKVPVDAIGIDLTKDDASRRIWAYCRAKGYTVDTLVNNAGIGFASRFQHISMDHNLHMMKLNTQAMVGMTHYFLPMILAQPQGRILFMSSMEATLSLPYKSVYTGTKSFIYAFALALREELKQTGVKIHVACPGPVLTNSAGLKRIDCQGWKARILMKSPETVVSCIMAGMEKNAVKIVPGVLNRLLIRVAACLPRATRMNVLERICRAFNQA
jgi:short-subunit dehydrogenase